MLNHKIYGYNPTESITTVDLLVRRHLRDILNCEPIIAGGAVRDAFFGRPINDVDIFVGPFSNLSQIPSAEMMSNSINMMISPNKPKKSRRSIMVEDVGSSYPGHRSELESEDKLIPSTPIVGIHNVQLDNYDRKYQIIYLGIEPHAYVQDFFQVGLSVAFIDKFGASITSECLSDYNNKQLTLRGKMLDSASVYRVKNEYVPKLQNKYRGFAVHMPTSDITKTDSSRNRRYNDKGLYI